jgi:hypothetical protein
MEGEALAGMTRTVDRLRPVIFAECNTVDVGHAIQRALHGRGYRFYLIATGCYHAGNHRHEPRNCFGPACETSLLCLPEGVQCPTSSPRRWQVAEVETLHQLADGLLRVPRYGDRTSFSRDPEQLEGELLAALERIAIADQERTRIKADRLSA